MGTGDVLSYHTNDNISDTDKIQVKYDIDPSLSGITDENVRLATYLHDKLLNIDIFDADSHFLFATGKLPLYDLLRQQAPFIVKAKRVECTDPDLPESRGEIKMIIRHEGHTERDNTHKIDGGKFLTMRDSQGRPDSRYADRSERIQPT